MAPLITSTMPSNNAAADATTASAAALTPAVQTSTQQAQQQCSSTPGAGNNRKKKTLGLAAQKEIWNLEQEVIAALVRVEPDPPVDTSVIANDNFHLVRDNHKDIFSFSTSPELYGGVDVSFSVAVEQDDADDDANSGTPQNEQQEAEDEQAVAVYVVVDRRTMKVVYHDHLFFDLHIPYIPTYLAFREIAPLEELVQRQIQCRPEMTPNAILVDGNGILHPRHAGIACFLGTRTDIPTIGIGKSLFHQGGWTRESVDEALDAFIRKIHRTVGDSSNKHLAEVLSRYRGLIMKKTKGDDPLNVNGGGDMETTTMSPTEKTAFDRKQALQDLAPYSSGLGIPLTVAGADSKPHANKMDDDDDLDALRFPVLGCALVGHGGQIAATTHSQPHSGSSKPIFVSIGHKMSLQEAVQVTASLSMARVPEPIRQADALGRQLMRQRAAAKVASNN